MTPNPRAAMDLKRTLGRWLGALVGTLALTGAAAAQTPAQDTTRVIPITPVTVTVLRDAVGAGREPYPVASLGEVALRQGKTGAFLEEALDGLPGVQVQNRYNYAVGERLSIRGFGPRAQFGVRGVRILVDGIPATVADGQSALEHIDLGSIGRVEVLRGPSSALYGNAGGGVVTFWTHAPAEESFRPEARAVFGSNGLANVVGGASGTAGSTGYLVSLSRLEYEGFRSNPVNRAETYGSAERMGANAQVLQPLAGGDLRVTLNYLDLDAENPGSLTALYQRDTLFHSAFRDNVARWRAGKTITQGQLGASWNGNAGPVGTELSAWGITRDLRNPTPFTIIDLGRKAGGARVVLRGAPAVGGRELSWGLGGELELQSDDRKNFVNNPAPGTTPGVEGALTLDQHERVLGTGVFGLARFVPVSRVELSAALRYDRFDFNADDNFPVTAGNADDSGTRVMDAISPSAGVFIDIAPAIGIFASAASALETPTTTELTNRPEGAGGFNPALEPQKAVTIEGGLRGQLSGRLGYEVAVFHTDVQDELVPFEVPQQAGRSFYRNAGGSTHKGVEAALRAALTDALSAQVTWSHVNARFDEFTVGTSNFAGNRVPGLAPNHVEGLLRGEWRSWFGDVKVEWVDDVPVDNAGQFSSPAYTVVDLRTGLSEYVMGGLSLSPFVGVANVMDESYNGSVSVNAVGGRFFEPGPGRTFHVGLSAAWSR